MLRYWLAATFVCDVLRIVLRLVSVAVLWFALPAVGSALLLPAVGSALVLPAVGFALAACCWLCSFGSFRHSPDSSRGPRTLVALLHSSRRKLVGCDSVSHSHYWLLGCGSFSDSLTTGSLAVVSSVLLLQSHFVVVHDSVVRFWLRPTPLLSTTPLRD